MIHNTEFYDRLEEYCLDKMDRQEKQRFEAELKLNEELRIEVQLFMEIQQAVIENDVLTLKDSLKEVATQNKPETSVSDSFELLEDYSNITEMSKELDSEELINFFDSLPKAHAYQHERTSNETIHQFYKEQEKSAKKEEEKEATVPEDLELAGLEEAILERDILDLRQKLDHVARSIEPKYSSQEIDEFLNMDLTEEQMLEFEGELTQNEQLKEEVRLHKEVEKAVHEEDVMELRNRLTNVVKSETSWNVSEQSIEDFIDGILEGELLDEFNAEFDDNSDLRAEVKLRKDVNEILSEQDILDLRKGLDNAKDQADTKRVKLVIPEPSSRKVRMWRNRVAMIVILLGLAGVFNNMFVSMDTTVEKFYEVPEWSAERTAVDVQSIHQNARMAYMNNNPEKVITVLDGASEVVNSYPNLLFFKASSYQMLDKFDEAIALYSQVINHGDNQFIEESEWYRSLCFISSGEKAKAKQELLAVIERKGFYEKDAKAIIRRLRYSKK